MYIILNNIQMSQEEIGQTFGGRDHASVIHARKVTEEKIKSNPTEEPMIRTILSSVMEKSIK
jgi:chromosomal replication initiation ATPase DnaA